MLLLTSQASGQAPGLVWSTNVGGTLFALDAQANLYATGGTNVIKISSAGQALQTNNICPLPGLVRRDADGNYYFAGTLTGTQDFGGVVLSVQYNSICFLAKYSSAGTLLWATNFGPNNIRVGVTDLELDPAGNVYVGHRLWLGNGTIPGVAYLARITPAGDIVWDITFQSGFTQDSLQVNPVSTTNCFVLHYCYGPWLEFFNSLKRVDESGNATVIDGSAGGLSAVRFVVNGRPVCNSEGQVYAIKGDNITMNSSKELVKYTGQPGGVIWRVSLGTNARWALGADWAGGVYVAGQDYDGTIIHQLSRFNGSGQLLWTMNPAGRCDAVIADSHGNLFASFSDGTVARFANEAPAPKVAASHYDSSGFSFEIQGILPAYRIWTNSGLGAWSESAVITNSGGTVSFNDPSAINAPMRFYRVEPLP